MPIQFLSEEAGAVTVDWVVLTAALVGLGLASMTLVSGGVEDLSGDIVGGMDGDSIIRTSFFRAATEGFVADAVLSVGQDFSDLVNGDAFSFQMEATLGADSNGILFEAGGTGRGTILYQHDGVLYLQAGDGGDYGEAANRGEALWTVSEGTHVIEGSLDADNGLALYVDGDLVSQSSFTAPGISGGDHGAVGNGNRSVSINRGGYVEGDGHSGAGEMSLFVGQTTGDEVGT